MQVYSAGYSLTRLVETRSRSAFNAADLLPAWLVSLSSCVAPRLPDGWCVAWATHTDEERRERAAAFGISADRLSALIDRVSNRMAGGAGPTSIGWPATCYTLDEAGELAARFVPPGQPDLLVVGLGLAAEHRTRLLAEPWPDSLGSPGVRDALLAGRPLEPGGELLGHELLAFDHDLGCSWLCNGLERHFGDHHGLRPNREGLLDREAADRAALLLQDDDIGAEPGLWLPWQVVLYQGPRPSTRPPADG